ncbi:ABC transporter ATP-binding protein [Winogradskyella maritima]|uniref:ATP-binding cassette domain-containing protein n=1 Tax=Winogradskyella maritima TaxID=1517766 RepID=A0ABV8AJY5_9FLAO|nr:ABC transporter ATP-binding protein [Winogradskyella maritima]
MLFELDNVELYFKNKRILNGIYLKAETGKVTGILGRNGCGKSSLLNIAFGSLKAKYQLIRLDNTPVLKPLYQTKRVKYLPQYHFVPNSFRLAKVFKLYQLQWEDFAKRFPTMAQFEKHRFKNLSGGERRLIESYIILKSDSQIVLLDEPFSHLAPLHIDVVKELIEEEKQNKAIIISDHMYRHIIDMSDDLYLLKNGTTKLITNLTELEDYHYLSEGTLSN